MAYSYTYICFQIDAYEERVREAIRTGNRKMLEVVRPGWYYWIEQLNNCLN